MTPTERRLKTFFARNALLREPAELSIAAFALWAICDCANRIPDSEQRRRGFFAELIPLLEAAAVEPWKGFPLKVATEAMKESSAAGIYAINTPAGGRALGTLVLGAYFWVQDLLEKDFLVLAPGSSFDKAMDLLREDMELSWATMEQVERSARKLSHRMQERLEAIGLFLPVVKVVEVAA